MKIVCEIREKLKNSEKTPKIPIFPTTAEWFGWHWEKNSGLKSW
jgi:hypothetical protein